MFARTFSLFISVVLLALLSSFPNIAVSQQMELGSDSSKAESDNPTLRYREMKQWWNEDDNEGKEPESEELAEQAAYDAFKRFMHEAAETERQRYGSQMPSGNPSDYSFDNSGGLRVLAARAGEAWTNIGPSNAAFITNGSTLNNITDSGRTVDIVIDHTNNSVIYLAVAGGGVWKTFNGGSTWVPITENLGSLSVGGLAMDPSNAQTLYLGLGDAFDGTGLGVVKSTDGGITWSSPVFLGTSSNIREVTVSPTATNVILVATNIGLFRSSNSGVSFSNVAINTGLTAVPEAWDVKWAGGTNFVMSFIANPAATGTAATGQIWRSTDQGVTWVRGNGVTKTTGVRRISLAVAPSNRNTMYAMAADGSNSQLADFFRSLDNGVTWTALNANGTSVNYSNTNAESPGPRTVLGGQGFYNHALIVHPTNASQFFFGGQLLVGRATLSGSTWAYTQMSNWLAQYSLPYVHADMHSAAFDSAGNLYFGSDGGIFKSSNYGVSWTDDLNIGITTHLLYSVGSSPANGDAVIGGLQDNGTRVRSGATGVYNQIIGGDGFGSNISRGNANNMMGTLYYTRMYRSTNAGASFAATNSGITESNNSSLAPFNTKVHAWEGDATGNTVLTHTNFKVYRTTNYATGWTALGTSGLPTASWNIRNLGIAQSNANYVGVVGAGGSVYLTTNGGTSWSTPAALPNNGSSMSWISYDRTNPSIIYVASVAPSATATHLWKSTNGGASWAAIDGGGFPTGVPVNVVRTHPTDQNMVFAGTHLGIYQSTNGGTTWTRYGTNLPLVEITDIYISPTANLMRVATFGRGFWEVVPGVTNAAPVANFTFTTTGLTANFTDTSTDSDGTIASRAWTFGDGASSTSTNPSRTYAAAGSYAVTLTVTDNGGATANITRTVTVSAPVNQAPVANFTFTTSNLIANFTDTSTDADGTIASRSWTFGDGGTSTLTNPSRTYAAAGTYNVQLTVTDNLGATNSITKSVTVTATPTVVVLEAQTFETGQGNWLNVTGDSDNWTRDSAGTPSTGTGPSTGAGGSTWYMFVETSDPYLFTVNETAFLQGPVINGSNRTMTFDYHMYGLDIGTLHVDVLSGGIWTSAWSITGQQHTSNAAAYTRATVNLSSYTGAITIRFRAIAKGGWRGDTAIDNIEIKGNP